MKLSERQTFQSLSLRRFMDERFFRFSNLSVFSNIAHGVSLRSYGNMSFRRGEKSEAKKNRENFLHDLGLTLGQVVVPEIIHGSKVSVVSASDHGRGASELASSISDADGLLTKEKNLALMVTVADCIPVFAYDTATETIGLIHAGWRGIVGGIVKQMIETFQSKEILAENLIIGIGPGICQKHFVTRGEVLDRFVGTYPQASFVRNKHGYVDLKKILTNQLIESGILKQNIEVSSWCPVCANGIFGSHRLEGEKAPISAAVLAVRK